MRCRTRLDLRRSRVDAPAALPWLGLRSAPAWLIRRSGVSLKYVNCQRNLEAPRSVPEAPRGVNDSVRLRRSGSGASASPSAERRARPAVKRVPRPERYRVPTRRPPGFAPRPSRRGHRRTAVTHSEKQPSFARFRATGPLASCRRPARLSPPGPLASHPRPARHSPPGALASTVGPLAARPGAPRLAPASLAANRHRWPIRHPPETRRAPRAYRRG